MKRRKNKEVLLFESIAVMINILISKIEIRRRDGEPFA